MSKELLSLKFYNFFDVSLTKFKNNQILLNKISHRFLLTIKLITGWKSLIKPIVRSVIMLNAVLQSAVEPLTAAFVWQLLMTLSKQALFSTDTGTPASLNKD